MFQELDKLAEKLDFSKNSRIILHNMVMSNEYDYLSNIKSEWKEEYERDLIKGKKKYQNSTEINSKEDDLNINMILDNNMKEFHLMTGLNKRGYPKNVLEFGGINGDNMKPINGEIFGNSKLTELQDIPKIVKENTKSQELKDVKYKHLEIKSLEETTKEIFDKNIDNGRKKNATSDFINQFEEKLNKIEFDFEKNLEGNFITRSGETYKVGIKKEFKDLLENKHKDPEQRQENSLSKSLEFN